MNGNCYKSGEKKLRAWQYFFSKSKRYFVPLKKSDNRILFFVFDKTLLEEVCSDEKILAYLRTKGYSTDKGFNAILAELLNRLASQNQFPHEVGIFLGYPLADVIGFENDSSAFKYSGFWKVYGDLDSAERQMELYKSCSDFCMKWVAGGLSVPSAAKKYNHLRRRKLWQK